MGADTWAMLWDAHVIGGWEHQLYLDERTEGAWDLDLTGPTIAFGELVTPVQLLGTWSEQSETWMWSWANPSGLPEVCTAMARRLREMGRARGITELTEATLSEAEPFELAMVARGLVGGAGYRRCPYDGGAAFVLLTDESLYAAPEIPLARLVTVLGQVLGEAEMPHPARSIAAWATAHGLTCTQGAGELRVRSEEGDEGFFRLDADGNIVDINASLAGRG